ncbi:MAG: MerR family transcriptional regulator [Acidobacteria bacterium]|nr:MerR family transcriptional regulator [Acidobacteriota bacterium]
MSIGEVLAALKEQFPDATVSKIRFLESEGLIEPERTAAGYRKFYQKDLERLRFVLKLQRDQFLPLKVIRERLAAYDAGQEPQTPASKAETAPAPARPEAEPDEDFAESMTALHLTEPDLAGAAGLDLGQVRALREFGVICEHSMNGGAYYDQDDLMVSRVARDFLKFGIEPRHLKMFRHFAEREAALFEAVVLPALRHRSPESRRQATLSLSELARLSGKLRRAFLRQGLRAFLGGER